MRYNSSMERTVIMYHGSCPDGFGGAYAAWKKFGDTAEYVPLKRGRAAPEGFDGAHLYFIDFTYPQEIMDAYVKTAAKVTVLDHHLGVRDVVESMPEFVFDEKRSGATIAWNYFHPGIPIPRYLSYVEDGDLYTFTLPHARAALAYAYTQPFTFESWDALCTQFESGESFDHLLEKGQAYLEYHEHVVQNAIAHAELVEFEGYPCLLTGAAGQFVSDIGNRLANLRPPIAIVLTADAEQMHVSLRSDGSVNVAELAQKYGGNGHPAASGIRLPLGAPMPWKKIEDADSSD
jgi:nanoRNase/pAp phosphatase (c-di-AMP/oligoRNAs hydrolase)